MQVFGFRLLWSRIKAIRFLMADKTVPKTKKALIIAGIFYIIMPFDLVPILVFPFSLIDDIVIWLVILWYLRRELDSYWHGEKPKDYSQKFRGKRVVDDVEYVVVEDDEESSKEGGTEGKNNA
ncbi:MAG: YkvA family protein [Lentihominibacter sp.]|jgi:uncharacterized membrane protein YkvA (DUF1232 family)